MFSNVACDGIVSKDGRIRLALKRGDAIKSTLLINLLDTYSRRYGFNITAVKGNPREVSLTEVSAELKHEIGRIIKNLTLYDYKADVLLPIRKSNSVLNKYARRARPYLGYAVKLLGYRFTISHEWHRTNFEIYLRTKVLSEEEALKLKEELEKIGIHARKAGGRKCPQIRIGWTEILKLIHNPSIVAELEKLKKQAESYRKEGNHEACNRLITLIKETIQQQLRGSVSL